MKQPLESGQTILFVGASITDCLRREPEHAPLGRGFVRQFRDLLIVRRPNISAEVLNRGIGGNTVDDLRSRWHEDVLTHRPNYVVMLVGINDVNQFLCQPELAFHSPGGYAEIYDTLLARTLAALPTTQLLLLSPFFISTDSDAGSYRNKALHTLPAYIEVVRSLAATYAADFLDLHAIFQSRLLSHHPDVYCEEPVHPNATGHAVIADAVFSSLIHLS